VECCAQSRRQDWPGGPLQPWFLVTLPRGNKHLSLLGAAAGPRTQLSTLALAVLGEGPARGFSRFAETLCLVCCPLVSDAETQGPPGPGLLSSQVSLDSFTKIKAMMDKMVADLKTEQEEEVKFKAYCQKEFSANEKATYEKTEEKKDLEAKIEELGGFFRAPDPA